MIPNRDKEEFKRLLIKVLGRGQGKALPGKLLAGYCGYDSNGSDRHTRMMIRELIEDGIPIASSTGKLPGFFIVQTQEEADEYAEGLRTRGIEDFRRRRDFLRASKKALYPEQLKMEI